MITVVDPHRGQHTAGYYPGEINVRMADAIVINKISTRLLSSRPRPRDKLCAI
jgi:predicted GTPase